MRLSRRSAARSHGVPGQVEVADGVGRTGGCVPRLPASVQRRSRRPAAEPHDGCSFPAATARRETRRRRARPAEPALDHSWCPELGEDHHLSRYSPTRPRSRSTLVLSRCARAPLGQLDEPRPDRRASLGLSATFRAYRPAAWLELPIASEAQQRHALSTRALLSPCLVFFVLFSSACLAARR